MNMRFNKQELFTLASQTSQNFDREGVLVLKERQDGFFRRSEGCSVRWFRLRGNLLFYLKGPEPWYEPMGVIVLGHHQVKLQAQDENGHWPFQIVWENGVCYRVATYQESERTLWLNTIEMASYEHLSSQILALKERLNTIRPIIDIASYRMQKGIVTDLNEVPLCELALSCDNLLCDAFGRPPSPMIVVHVKYPKGLSVRYGSTEVVEKCSNPCFSKTILFRSSDGLTGEALVRIAVHDMRERVSETALPMGFTALKLSTIEEAQRLRMALMTSDNKTVGFVTIHGWSLEPSYIGTSPSHTNDRNSIDIPQKVLCHRRSQSLPPRLGLKLKFPSYGSLLKQNLANSHQVTYRFHSGLGGDINVHEIMAEAKLCYQMPIQLLDIYISREKELLEELLSVGEMCGHWRRRQLELAAVHASLLKRYTHSKRCMQQVDHMYFKASSRKDEAGLEFAPVNLHLQRVWAHNDTLNKSGFHDVVTAGAFTAHAHNAERTGGLIRLVQESKDVDSGNPEISSAASKIQADYDNVTAVTRLGSECGADTERVTMLLQARQTSAALALLAGIKCKIKCILALWDPIPIEESLSYIGWPRNKCNEGTDSQTMATIMRITEQLGLFEALNSDCDTFDASSSSSSKETSPTLDLPSLASSIPNIFKNKDVKVENSDLFFYPDYFKNEREDKSRFAEVKSPVLESKVRHGSFRKNYKCPASTEQMSYKCLLDNHNGNEKRKNSIPGTESHSLGISFQPDPVVRESNLVFLKGIGTDIESSMNALVKVLTEYIEINEPITDDDLEHIKQRSETLDRSVRACWRALGASHAASRLRLEHASRARRNAALQARRDACFTQALATVSLGLVCWFCSTPADIVLRVITSRLGPLCSFEGLLSLYAAEKAMWGDMAVALEDLHSVEFKIAKVAHSNAAIPQVTGTRGALTVHIPVSDSLYTKFTADELSFNITVVFFNIGINEKASLAEALGETAPQQHSNSDNLDRILKYWHEFSKVFPGDQLAATRASSRTKPLEEVMENLNLAVHKKVPKNVEVLHLAAQATRLMNGVRFTSCKSAKDRSGMSVTLEQCNILAGEYHLAGHEMKKALDMMRSEGCRRENTFKNIGVKKYAFSKKQVAALPEDYRPPPGTYGSTRT